MIPALLLKLALAAAQPAGPPVAAAPQLPVAGQTPEAYEAQVLRDAASEQAKQGPLDGPWTLRDSMGRPLYRIRIVDPGTGPDPLEAVWLNPRHHGPKALGLAALIAWDGPDLMLRFQDGKAIVITVRPGAGGIWDGHLWRGRAYQAVSMRRD